MVSRRGVLRIFQNVTFRGYRSTEERVIVSIGQEASVLFVDSRFPGVDHGKEVVLADVPIAEALELHLCNIDTDPTMSHTSPHGNVSVSHTSLYDPFRVCLPLLILTSVFGVFHTVAFPIVHLELLIVDEELTSRNLTGGDVGIWMFAFTREFVRVLVRKLPHSFHRRSAVLRRGVCGCRDGHGIA